MCTGALCTGGLLPLTRRLSGRYARRCRSSPTSTKRGLPSLTAVDPEFPIFVLCVVVFDRDEYVGQVVPAVYELKMDIWEHEGLILHSRDIRRAQGDFIFLRDRTQRQPFYERLNAVIRAAPMQVLAVAVRKDAHLALHGGRARDPYDLALRFAFERVALLLEDAGETAVRVVAEARTPQQDDLLRLSLQRLLRRGTSTMPAQRFARLFFELTFLPKMAGVVGTQLADLMAYPIARYVVAPARANRAFTVVEPKLCRRNGTRIGLAIYPPTEGLDSEVPESRTAPQVQGPFADRELPSLLSN